MANFPTNGDDTIKGTNGNDRINGLAGDDKISGFNGRDELYGGTGDDRLLGGDERDFLFGGRGDDVLLGQEGNDYLNGGRDNDRLLGDSGNDVLIGGEGADYFYFRVNATSAAGKDSIVDFNEHTELINLGSYGSWDDLDTNGDLQLTDADAFVSVTDQTTRIDVGAAFGFTAGNEVLTVTNVVDSPLDWDDFSFIG